MKKIILALAFCNILVNGFSQVQSNCQAPASLLAAYEIDASSLALSRIIAIGSADTASIIIPQTSIDTVWHGLSAIFNLTSSPERDSVFNIYCVHNESPNTLKIIESVYVSVGAGTSMAQAWKLLQIVTGNTVLDNFLAAYGFTVTYYSTISNVATLTTNQVLNMYAVADSLESFSGVNYSIPNIYAGDANRIYYSKTGDDMLFEFMLGWGDCQSGCINRYSWKFNVSYNNCTVNYLGFTSNIQTPDPFPSPVNCNLATHVLYPNNEDMIRIYPNPATEFIFIEGEEIQEIRITDVAGKIMHIETGISHPRKIDLSGWSSGTYLINAVTKSGTATRAIVKN